MEFQGRLGLLPKGAEILSETLAVSRADDGLLFFNPGGPILRAAADDPEQVRLAGVQLLDPDIGGGVKVGVLAGVLDVHRSSLHRWRRAYEAESLEGLRSGKRGPKGPHKLRGAVLAQGQRDLDRGLSQTEAARRAGVTEGAIRRALSKGQLRRPEARTAAAAAAAAVTEALSGPGERNERDRTSPGGVAVKRHEERFLAWKGALPEAAPEFGTAGSVAKAGVLVALPVVVAQGLYEVGKQVYGMLKNGFYGLDAVLSTLVFMALLRIKSIEQLPSHAPGEFGLVLGLDRSPEMKTLRRKLAEMGARGQALELGAAFAHRWAEEQPELLGFLYVDGHVRPYNGRKHELPKTHVPRRRLCMPATTDYWVNDAFSDPLFYVTAPGNEGLLAMLEDEVLPEARRLAGRRRVTLIMDRECWSPDSFQDWSLRGFDVMTYRKGSYEPWPGEEFAEHTSRDGATRDALYKLAERPLTLSNGFEVREVRCLTEDGHQTSIVTTRTDLTVLEVARRMFSRWRQENFFRYMRHEFDLDHLPTPAVEPADPQRPVPNPARRAKKKELDAARQEFARLKQAYGEVALAGTVSLSEQGEELRHQVDEQEARVEQLQREYRALPSHVPIGQVQDPATVVRLEAERKRIVDQVKMVAYRAETELANLVGPLLGWHHADEARSFLRQVFELPAHLVPDPEAGTLRVRLHCMANARSNRALAGLCEVLNAYQACYPGTGLRLVLEAPPSEE
jgi:transcriptional regulator with XRE-family HTH domain